MANNHSAEWLRGAIEALDRARRDFTVTVPELQAEYVALLAAAEAREKAALGTDWDDPEVQYVYRLLCFNELPGSPEEHWEGKVARMAVAYLRSRAAEAREAGESDSIKLAKLIDGMFYCEGGGYDSDDVREGIQKAFEIGVQSAGKTETSETGERKQSADDRLEEALNRIYAKYGPRLDLFFADVDKARAAAQPKPPEVRNESTPLIR